MEDADPVLGRYYRVVETLDFETTFSALPFKLYRLEIAQANDDCREFRAYRYRLSTFGVPPVGIENWEQLRWEKQHYHDLRAENTIEAREQTKAFFLKLIRSEIAAVRKEIEERAKR